VQEVLLHGKTQGTSNGFTGSLEDWKIEVDLQGVSEIQTKMGPQGGGSKRRPLKSPAIGGRVRGRNGGGQPSVGVG